MTQMLHSTCQAACLYNSPGRVHSSTTSIYSQPQLHLDQKRLYSMGAFTASAQAPLHPVNPPIGIFPYLYAKEPTALNIKEKISWSGDDFAVKDLAGWVVVRCEGQAFSYRDRKIIRDSSGKFLFCLRNKIMTFFKTIIAEDEHGQELFRVQKHFAFGAKAIATFHDAATNVPMALSLRGDFWGGSADISVVNGPVIAQIYRDVLNAREIFAGQQTVSLTTEIIMFRC
ncbi:hypothetical protein, variant 2 [Cryptococcus amylolentus CBS 6039]|uniref:Phospholipid scramblase n=1 Tax=Cryptococcus amylolentus CBS 6039 TaxID=1295533 RepID=A0A1E3HNH7_9TREE|nr:hypothetical protein, variant 2 [Cryptococcus amylolentus CBS 6039]ODN77884.1 hypothetical protein, variant 2 [Cryptococcus amylolentus CBS 6039]